MATQERAVRTRSTLIESAAALFARDGFDPVTLAAISTRAGVSSGALHFHFASKEALADAVVRQAGERLDEITGRQAGHPLQTLIDAMHCLADSLRSDIVLRAGFELSCNLGRARATRDLRRSWQEWVEGCLALAEGELTPGIAVQDVATAVVAAVAGFEMLGSRDPQWFSHATVTGFWAVLLPTLVEGPVLSELVASGVLEGCA